MQKNAIFPPRVRRVALALAAAAAAAFGQTFIDATGPAGLGNFTALPGDGHGPGAVFADLDNDGYPDLYLIGQDPVDASGLYNSVYVNRPRGGGRAFEPLAAAGGRVPYRTNGAVAGDYDNDGDLDLYVVAYGPNVLFRNELVETGTLAFTDVTAATDPTPGNGDRHLGVGLARGRGCDGKRTDFNNSLTAAWADVDRDGDLDLYVGTHNGFALSQDEAGNFGFDPDRPPVQTEDPKPGSRDTLYLNNGVAADGSVTFTDVTRRVTPTAGLTGFETATGAVETPYQCFASSNAVIFTDLNLDLWPDLVVTNKTVTPDDRDMLYLNRGADAAGRWRGFEAASYTLEARCYGTPRCFGLMSPAAMGIDAGDPDNDGDFDLYITDIRGNPEILPPPYDRRLFNDLWVNQLTESGTVAFVYDPRLPLTTSWGAQWGDFDNDGDEDLHVTSSFADGFYLNRMNTGHGLRFSEQAAHYGVAHPADGRGGLTADFDRDGWVDILAIHRNDPRMLPDPPVPSVLWHNNLSSSYPRRRHLSVKLVGDPSAVHGPWRSSRDAIGARVRVYADLDRDGTIAPHEVQMREVRSGSSNAASTSSLELEVGLKRARRATLEVFWPSGKESIHEVQANQHLRIKESGEVERKD